MTTAQAWTNQKLSLDVVQLEWAYRNILNVEIKTGEEGHSDLEQGTKQLARQNAVLIDDLRGLVRTMCAQESTSASGHA